MSMRDEFLHVHLECKERAGAVCLVMAEQGNRKGMTGQKWLHVAARGNK